jgi:TolB-like protein/predicted Zn-dependent protease
MSADLRRLAAPTPAATLPGTPRRIASLAVLPLQDLSGDPAQEFFADGLTEALITTLAQLSALRVISRTSVMQYKGASKPLPEIARALGVEAVVEGSVVRSGGRVRITAQLIEAATDHHLWAHSYERDLGDVLALQSEVAEAIAEEVHGHLTPQERDRLAGGRSVDPGAYESYLRGRYFWNKRDPAEVRKAVQHFNEAIAADPTYALAYTGLADSYNILGDQHAVPPSEAAPRARAATLRALELDPQLAEAHSALGFSRMFYEWDWMGTEQAYRRAVALNPGYATAHQWLAEYLVSQGRFDEAIAEARHAHHLDPLAFIMGTTLGDVLYFSRRYDEAIAELHAIVQMEPNFVHAVNDLGRAYTERGMFAEAFAAFADAARRRGGDLRSSAGLARAYALAGRQAEARAGLATLVERTQRQFVSPFAIGTIHAALGEHDQAFEWLERALAEHDTAMVWIKVHPRVDVLRDDPRMESILQRMHLA